MLHLDLRIPPVLLTTLIVLAANIRTTKPQFELPIKDQLYDQRRQKCCMGNVTTLPHDISPRSLRCCASEAYDPVESICCSYALWKRFYGMHTECCSSDIYDSRTYKCCEGVPVRLPDEMKTVDNQYIKCCGYRLYDSRTQLCCGSNNVLNKKPKNAKCCQDNIYDPSKEACCDGKIHNVTSKNTDCCFGVPFDADKSMCCTVGPHIRQSSRPNSRCCGDGQEYDPNKAICEWTENGLTVSKLTPTPPTIRRCGNGFCDITQNVCCDGKCLPSNNGRTGCCHVKAYNIETHLCCDGKLSLRTGAGQRCCGRETYDVFGELCCAGKRKPKTNYKTTCCEEEPYDPRVHTCCNGKLLAISEPSKASCCPAALMEEACLDQQTFYDQIKTVILDHNANEMGISID